MKTYNTVEEMTKDILGNEAVENMNKHGESVKLITLLVSSRLEKGITRKQLSQMMKIGERKLCKMENGCDADLTLGNIVSYVHALGLSVNFELKNENEIICKKI